MAKHIDGREQFDALKAEATVAADAYHAIQDKLHSPIAYVAKAYKNEIERLDTSHNKYPRIGWADDSYMNSFYELTNNRIHVEMENWEHHEYSWTFPIELLWSENLEADIKTMALIEMQEKMEATKKKQQEIEDIKRERALEQFKKLQDEYGFK